MKDTGYELFIAGVAVLSIMNIVLILALNDPMIDTVLLFMNGLFSLILLGDFAYRFRTADSRSEYFFRRFGWADLFSCLPLPQLKVLRLFRLVRVYRLLRALGARHLVRAIVDNTAGSALLTLLFVALLVLQFGSLAMLLIESGAPGANITTASDALWYMLATMSTVGYGDQYPVTTAGRLLGAVVIIVGVGIFGTLTGFLANAFVRSRGTADGGEEEEEPADGRLVQLRQLREEQAAALARLDRLIAEESAT